MNNWYVEYLTSYECVYGTDTSSGRSWYSMAHEFRNKRLEIDTCRLCGEFDGCCSSPELYSSSLCIAQHQITISVVPKLRTGATRLMEISMMGISGCCYVPLLPDSSFIFYSDAACRYISASAAASSAQSNMY